MQKKEKYLRYYRALQFQQSLAATDLLPRRIQDDHRHKFYHLQKTIDDDVCVKLASDLHETKTNTNDIRSFTVWTPLATLSPAL